MQSANCVFPMPRSPLARPVPSSIHIAANGNALRTGMPLDDLGLQGLFRTLEACDCQSLCLLQRPDVTLVSALRREVVNGRESEWELMRLSDDLFVRLSNTACEKSAVFPISGEGLIEFHFRLSGRLSLSEDANPALQVDRGSFLIWRQPVGRDVTGRLDTNEREASMTIYLRPEALKRYFGEAADLPASDILQRLCSEDAELVALRLALIPRLAQLVHDLSTLNAHGPRRIVQAEALVMLILCEIVGMLEETPHDVASSCRVTDLDIRCLRRARTILQERYSAPPTIEALAREVGMGTTKLKNGFKCLFGTTICQFTNEIRMERARELLLKPDMAISLVAEMLGYEYQNSFTAAFRRHFSVLPKDYRRDPLVLRVALPSARPE